MMILVMIVVTDNAVAYEVRLNWKVTVHVMSAFD